MAFDKSNKRWGPSILNEGTQRQRECEQFGNAEEGVDRSANALILCVDPLIKLQVGARWNYGIMPPKIFSVND